MVSAAAKWIVRALGRPLEVHARVTTADVIVVLGAPLREDGTLSDVLEERVVAGVALYRAGAAPVVCMSGGRAPGARAQRSEAAAMAERAVALGVPDAAVVCETASSNTSTNARNIKEMSCKCGWRKAILVSQPFHLRRARLWFRRGGMDVETYWIRDSLQYRDVTRGARWVVREYASLARDLLVTRRAGDSRL